MIEVRPIEGTEINDAVVLWKACGLVRPHNDAAVDAAQALKGQNAAIIGAIAGQHLIGAAMIAWDGAQGWISYLGVERAFRRWGLGRKLVRVCEDWLGQSAPSHIQLMARAETDEAARFYKGIGYEEKTPGVLFQASANAILIAMAMFKASCGKRHSPAFPGYFRDQEQMDFT
ncbi:GNAT family N-acetyltransferase [Sphingobium vermicomposti]|uniref:GNAT superfamily N-acetyltransferase n=1 Tax=Sphingobium vermicomposti TaxID=529005 RepID=A0A846M3M6_9SPHN|nr:GNAT family N-acetyltransferase [Sphingobium vermicomposti]NIJ15370.1 GNAT superfamily N-acetyltransferase [Sphingobium vermicomposti]